MSKSNNTVRSTESKAIYTHAEEKASNQMRPVGKKVERSAETAPWVGDDCILDHAFVADMTEEAPNDMQNRLRNEANAKFIDREKEAREEAIPSFWANMLESTDTIVYGYYSDDVREGEHKVRHVVVDSDEPNKRRPWYSKVTPDYEPYMKICLEDTRTHKRWDVSIRSSKFVEFVTGVAQSNNGLCAGEKPGEVLETLKRKDFRCWTLIDDEKSEGHKVRTFFTSSKYTQVYNAIQKKKEEEEKKKEDKQ